MSDSDDVFDQTPPRQSAPADPDSGPLEEVFSSDELVDDLIDDLQSDPDASPLLLEAESSLAPGMIVASRYLVLRLIGADRGGELYEAEDIERSHRVVLKTIPGSVSADGQALEQLHLRVSRARSITHLNIGEMSAIQRYDTGRLQVDFVALEIPSGSTLRETVEAQGRFSEKDAWPVIQGITDALSAAHDAGVMHGDFRMETVVIADATAGQGPRVTVSGFGLAASGESSSPEGSVDRTSDIHALGRVLYEMMTGRDPFDGTGSTATRRSKKPVSLRTIASEVSTRWDHAILRCLEPDPGRRFQSIADVAAALAPAAKASTSPRAAKPKRSDFPWRVPVLTILGAIVIVGGSIAFLQLREKPKAGTETAATNEVTSLDESRPPIVSPRRSIAVLGFNNLSRDKSYDWMGLALAEMISAQLGSSDAIRTIPRDDVVTMRNNLALPRAPSYSADVLLRIRNNIGTDLLVVGSYLLARRSQSIQIRLDLRVQDTATGRTIKTLTEAGTDENLTDLAERAGTNLLHALGAEGTDHSAVKAALPSSPGGARFYVDGLEELRRFRAASAKDRFVLAIAADPDFSDAHFAIASAWESLGYAGESRDAYAMARTKSVGLRREHRLAIEGEYRATTLEWDQAIHAYQQLFDFYGDNVDYGLRLAALQIRGEKARDALTTIERLKRLPAPLGADPRIPLAEAETFLALGEFTKVLDLAAANVEQVASRGATDISARFRNVQGAAFEMAGATEKAIESYDAAIEIDRKSNNLPAVAKGLRALAAIYDRQGKFPLSREKSTEAIALLRPIGYHGQLSAALVDLAHSLEAQGALNEAAEALEESLQLAQQRGSTEEVARTTSSLAELKKKIESLNATTAASEALPKP